MRHAALRSGPFRRSAGRCDPAERRWNRWLLRHLRVVTASGVIVLQRRQPRVRRGAVHELRGEPAAAWSRNAPSPGRLGFGRRPRRHDSFARTESGAQRGEQALTPAAERCVSGLCYLGRSRGARARGLLSRTGPLVRAGLTGLPRRRGLLPRSTRHHRSPFRRPTRGGTAGSCRLRVR